MGNYQSLNLTIPLLHFSITPFRRLSGCTRQPILLTV
jgi:hypothetical protein